MTSRRDSYLRAAAIGAALAVSPAAWAADLPSRTITPVAPLLPAPAFSFTGPYVGLSVGGDFLNKNTTTTALATGLAVDTASAAAAYNDERVRLGGYIGYNYQIDQIVVGVEGDGAYDFGHQRTTVGIPGTLGIVAAVSPTNADSTSSNSRYDASVRGRLGVVILPTLMFYATGGVAFRDSSLSLSCPSGPASYCFQPEAGGYSGTRVGYTVGGGLEGLVFDNLVARIEYRYSDFGTRTLNFFGPANAPAADFIAIRSRLTASTVTVGLAYKFDLLAPMTPVVARY